MVPDAMLLLDSITTHLAAQELVSDAWIAGVYADCAAASAGYQPDSSPPASMMVVNAAVFNLLGRPPTWRSLDACYILVTLCLLAEHLSGW